MARDEAWILKNKRGAFVVYFCAYRRYRVIEKIGKARWESWKAQGEKIVKVKLVEVK